MNRKLPLSLKKQSYKAELNEITHELQVENGPSEGFSLRDSLQIMRGMGYTLLHQNICLKNLRIDHFILESPIQSTMLTDTRHNHHKMEHWLQRSPKLLRCQTVSRIKLAHAGHFHVMWDTSVSHEMACGTLKKMPHYYISAVKNTQSQLHISL